MWEIKYKKVYKKYSVKYILNSQYFNITLKKVNRVNLLTFF